jgi:type VI secretion system protein ImpA
MIVAEDLLKPISEENPCGEDLSYDAKFQELETLAHGKPETQFSAAEPPDWKQLNSRCLELFARSKDLRIAVLFCAVGLELDRLPGFRESLLLVKGLLERYWDAVHPRLDPADNNDPLERINIVASLTMPVGSLGDSLQILGRLRAVPLCSSVQLGRYTMADILRSSEAGTKGADGKPPASAAEIEATFRDSDPVQLQEISGVLGDCVALVRGVDEYLTKTVGPASAPDLTPLSTLLAGMQKQIAPYLPVAALPEETPTDLTVAAGDSPRQPSLTGEIRSREDVLKMLRKICDYYKRAEPSSPVPLILKRAERLAEMDFIQIMQDLSPEAIATIQTITGSEAEGK